MFHKAALTSRHEIKMFVEAPKWEMTRGQRGKREGEHIQRQKAALVNTVSTGFRCCTTAQTSSDSRADTAALPGQEKPRSVSSPCPTPGLNPQQPLISSLRRGPDVHPTWERAGRAPVCTPRAPRCHHGPGTGTKC